MVTWKKFRVTGGRYSGIYWSWARRTGGRQVVRQPDDAVFAELYRRYHRPVHDFCRRRVASDLVDDAVAETFLTAWRRLDDVPAGEAALVWTVRRRLPGDRPSAAQRPPGGAGSRAGCAAIDASTRCRPLTRRCIDGDEYRLVLDGVGPAR